MSSTFYYLYRFLINLTATLVGVIIIYGIGLFAFNVLPNAYLQIVVFMLGILIGVISASYLLVMLLIPFQIQKQFDPIKNKVALNEYASVDEFQNDVAEFIVSFFRYPGANVSGGVFKFTGASPLYLNVDASTWEDFEPKKGYYSKKHKAFAMDVKLGEVDLGKFYVVTRGINMPLFAAILQDFEDYQLDDQLMHVVNYTRKN